jgi:hypothetical protein
MEARVTKVARVAARFAIPAERGGDIASIFRSCPTATAFAFIRKTNPSYDFRPPARRRDSLIFLDKSSQIRAYFDSRSQGHETRT